MIQPVILAIEVQAATSTDVTITYTPSGLFAPTDFTATAINDSKITLTWTPNVLAVTTHIRGKVGSYPINVNDGYEVYNGAGNTVDDNSVSLDETAADIYYIAYSVDGGGVHSLDYAQANAGGTGMTLIAFFGLGLFLTWIGAKSHWIYRFLAGAAWLAIAALWVAPTGIRPTYITAGSDADRILVTLFIGAGCACLLLILYTYDTKEGRGSFGFPSKLKAFLDGNSEQETDEYEPNRFERTEAYATRVQAAANGTYRRRR